MGQSSKILLDLEANKSSTSSSLESRLLLSNNDLSLQSQTTKINPPDTKPTISSVPKSQILGKLKNFLPVMSEANKRLQLAAMDNSKDFDIEALEDNDSTHIEMDLMLGVADLHTPEAIAAAKSAIDGHLPVIPFAASNNSDEDDDDDSISSDEEAEDNKKVTCSPIKRKGTKHAGDESSEALTNKQSEKRPKIIELL